MRDSDYDTDVGLAVILCLYAFVALVTFAYDATRYPDMDLTFCTPGPECPPREKNNTSTAMKAIFAGLGWPVFWTWEIADKFVSPAPVPQATPSPEASNNA